jgi:hypothetical protein
MVPVCGVREFSSVPTERINTALAPARAANTGLRALQFGSVFEAHDLATHATGRRADAAAERRDGQRLWCWRQDAGALEAALPHRERHRLQVNAWVTELLELGDRPGHAFGIVGAAGHAMTDFGGQRFDYRIGVGALEGVVAQGLRRSQVGIGQRAGGGDAAAQQQQQTTSQHGSLGK